MLSGLCEAAPGFETFCTELSAPGGRARAMSRLLKAEGGDPCAKGIRFKRKKGVVIVRPDSARDSLLLKAESASMETSRELCDAIKRELGGNGTG